jgi:hypothetical protein
VRCGERACPFCGAKVTSFVRVLEYRIVNRLDRSRIFSLGAALAAAGFVTNCESQGQAIYGAPCNPPACGPQAGSGGIAGEANDPAPGGRDGGGGEMATAGAAPLGEGGEPSAGGAGAQGGAGGQPPGVEGGAAGEGTIGGAGGAS